MSTARSDYIPRLNIRIRFTLASGASAPCRAAVARHSSLNLSTYYPVFLLKLPIRKAAFLIPSRVFSFVENPRSAANSRNNRSISKLTKQPGYALEDIARVYISGSPVPGLILRESYR